MCLITSGLVAVYMQKLGYWGVHVCGCAGRGLDVVPCWWSLYLCVGFFLWRRSCVFILSSCWGWGRLLLSLFWCGCSARFPGAPAVFRCVHAASYPSRVPHLADSGWLPYSCGGRLAWGWGCLGTDVLIPHLVSTLCRRNSPFRFFPFGVLHH